MQKIGKYTCRIIFYVNILLIFAIVGVAYAGYVSPVTCGYCSTITLSFPFFVIINILFLVLWLIVRRKYSFLPICGMLLCAGPIRSYCPLNLPTDVPDDALKVLSYNTLSFGHSRDADTVFPIFDYIKACDADIACLQESGGTSVSLEKAIKHISIYEHYDTAMVGKSNYHSLLTLSKYPIVGHYNIPMESNSNGALASWVKMKDDTIIVINVHLESNSLTETDKKEYEEVLRELKDNEVKGEQIKAQSHKMMGKLMAASVIRSSEAEALVRFITQHKGEDIILCGDFNDNPLSYTNHQIDKVLNNCYVASGNGPGISYYAKGYNVRIDNIYASDGWKSYGAKVDDSIKSSDHYPIFCYLSKQ